MNLPDITQANFGGKRVLIRVGFNVGFSDGKLSETHRIEVVKKTIDYVLSKKM